jgi:hypothetical protein
MIKKADIIDAANFLIQADNCTTLVNEITKIIARWDEHPMAYAGDLKCLNALVEVGLESQEAFEKVIAIVERRRRLLPAMKRVDYQRDLMRDRRARIAKALDLYQRSTGKTVTATTRPTIVAGIQARWKTAKARLIKAKGDLTWKERNDAAGEIWEMIDKQLDDNLQAAYKKSG